MWQSHKPINRKMNVLWIWNQCSYGYALVTYESNIQFGFLCTSANRVQRPLWSSPWFRQCHTLLLQLPVLARPTPLLPPQSAAGKKFPPSHMLKGFLSANFIFWIANSLPTFNMQNLYMFKLEAAIWSPAELRRPMQRRAPAAPPTPRHGRHIPWCSSTIMVMNYYNL